MSPVAVGATPVGRFSEAIGVGADGIPVAASSSVMLGVMDVAAMNRDIWNLESTTIGIPFALDARHIRSNRRELMAP